MTKNDLVEKLRQYPRITDVVVEGDGKFVAKVLVRDFDGVDEAELTSFVVSVAPSCWTSQPFFSIRSVSWYLRRRIDPLYRDQRFGTQWSTYT